MVPSSVGVAELAVGVADADADVLEAEADAEAEAAAAFGEEDAAAPPWMTAAAPATPAVPTTAAIASGGSTPNTSRERSLAARY
jgi:hypothetical protein